MAESRIRALEHLIACERVHRDPTRHENKVRIKSIQELKVRRLRHDAQQRHKRRSQLRDNPLHMLVDLRRTHRLHNNSLDGVQRDPSGRG